MAASLSALLSFPQWNNDAVQASEGVSQRVYNAWKEGNHSDAGVRGRGLKDFLMAHFGHQPRSGYTCLFPCDSGDKLLSKHPVSVSPHGFV